MSNTITLHRVLKTTPAKVYRAFTNFTTGHSHGFGGEPDIQQ